MSNDKKPATKEFPVSFSEDGEVQDPVPKKTFWGVVKDNPVPVVGATATGVILSLGLTSMMSNDKARANRMMRYRILAQGATVILGGLTVAWASTKNKEKQEDN